MPMPLKQSLTCNLETKQPYTARWYSMHMAGRGRGEEAGASSVCVSLGLSESLAGSGASASVPRADRMLPILTPVLGITQPSLEGPPLRPGAGFWVLTRRLLKRQEEV